MNLANSITGGGGEDDGGGSGQGWENGKSNFSCGNWQSTERGLPGRRLETTLHGCRRKGEQFGLTGPHRAFCLVRPQ